MIDYTNEPKSLALTLCGELRGVLSEGYDSPSERDSPDLKSDPEKPGLVVREAGTQVREVSPEEKKLHLPPEKAKSLISSLQRMLPRAKTVESDVANALKALRDFTHELDSLTIDHDLDDLLDRNTGEVHETERILRSLVDQVHKLQASHHLARMIEEWIKALKSHL